MDEGKVTSPPARKTISAMSPTVVYDRTDIVRPFFNTTISALATLAKNKEQKTNDKRSALGTRWSFALGSSLLLIE
jgi:hypothetical protein